MKYKVAYVKTVGEVVMDSKSGVLLSTAEVTGLLNSLEQRLAEAESRTCKWQEDSDTDNSLWNGGCGAVWEFIADGPLENKCNFCPECGGKLVIAECPLNEASGSEGE